MKTATSAAQYLLAAQPKTALVGMDLAASQVNLLMRFLKLPAPALPVGGGGAR